MSVSKASIKAIAVGWVVMPLCATQCYLLLCRDDIPAFTPAKLVLSLATTEGCKVELT